MIPFQRKSDSCAHFPAPAHDRAAAETRLQIAWVFSGEGGGTWTMEIHAGQIIVSELMSVLQHSDLNVSPREASA